MSLGYESIKMIPVPEDKQLVLVFYGVEDLGKMIYSITQMMEQKRAQKETSKGTLKEAPEGAPKETPKVTAKEATGGTDGREHPGNGSTITVEKAPDLAPSGTPTGTEKVLETVKQKTEQKTEQKMELKTGQKTEKTKRAAKPEWEKGAQANGKKEGQTSRNILMEGKFKGQAVFAEYERMIAVDKRAAICRDIKNSIVAHREEFLHKPPYTKEEVDAVLEEMLENGYKMAESFIKIEDDIERTKKGNDLIKHIWSIRPVAAGKGRSAAGSKESA